MTDKCPHAFKKIDGLYPSAAPGDKPMVAFTCLICRTSGGMEWEDTSKLEQDRALVLGYPGMYRMAGAM